ncbi:B-cell receptor CD22-like, partial [Silurus asotus]
LIISLMCHVSGALGNQWSVKYSKLDLCAVKGSTVVMEANYTHPTSVTVNNRFWLIDPLPSKDPIDLRIEPGYSGRVEYLGDEKNHFSLRLSDVKKSDEHKFTFRFITTKGGYQGHPEITLRVTDLQVIIPEKVTKGQSVILTCETTCSLTDSTFIWYKNRQDLTTKTFKSNELHLQRVSSEDAGSYNCAVRGSEHLPSPAQYLSVIDHQQKVSVSISPSAEIVEGSSVTLTCSCGSNPPVETYTWFKGTSSVGKGKTFTISKVSAEHSGDYKCMCSNKPEDQSSNIVTLIVLYPPKNVSISPSGEIVEGGSVTLTCSSDANRLLETFKWFKGTTSVGKGKTFTISKISSEDSGEYKCMCSNEVGNQNSSVTLNVLFSVSISPSGEIVEGISVTLTCSSDANPPVKTYTWFKGRTSFRKGKTFTISKISTEDSGKYKCMCNNKVGNQKSTSVTLNVLYPPKNISVSFSPSGEIVEGSSVTLTCRSDANPPVKTYTWLMGTTSVGNGETFTISKISSKDSEKYKCMCSNKVGHQNSTSVTLNVLYPPKRVSVSISISSNQVEGSSVTLTCSSDSNPPVETYTWFKENESSPLGSGQSYRALQSGLYYCEAHNKLGSERSAAVSITIT